MSRGRVAVASAGSEVAPCVQAQVEPVNLMPRRTQERNKDGTDVSAIARYQNLQLPALQGLAKQAG